MAGITRKLHFETSFEYAPVDKFCPDMDITMPADNGGGKPTVPMAISFRDPDGETHVFLLADTGRKKLIAKLTGGIVMPDGVGGIE